MMFRSHMAGEVLTIPQLGGKRERSLFKHPVCSESFPSLEIIKNGPRAEQLTVIVAFS